MLAAVRTVHRLERVGETLRAALTALATAAPDGLNGAVAPDGFERSVTRREADTFPKGEAARTALAETSGADGHRMVAAVEAPAAPEGGRDLAAVPGGRPDAPPRLGSPVPCRRCGRPPAQGR